MKLIAIKDDQIANGGSTQRIINGLTLLTVSYSFVYRLNLART